MKKLFVLLLFASIAIPGHSFGLARDESKDAWFVRTIVDSDEPICEGATRCFWSFETGPATSSLILKSRLNNAIRIQTETGRSTLNPELSIRSTSK